LQLYSSGTTGLPKRRAVASGSVVDSRTVAQTGSSTSTACSANALTPVPRRWNDDAVADFYTGGVTLRTPISISRLHPEHRAHGITHSFSVPAMLLFMRNTGMRKR